ncbi:glutamate-5-semialdehyde dehydrogenase [Acuticoccus sediminis]|nr:glutamate-5-semialdehyde dehydrogenase [Acuticoccus sediminis]
MPLTRDTLDTDALVAEMGRKARAAQSTLAVTPSGSKRAALAAMATEVRRSVEAILQANAADLIDMDAASAFRDRAMLSADRIEAMAAAIEAVADLPDPVGRVLASWERPNGLRIDRVATPLGVVGVIYESRPNVTADAASLCVMAGNAVILRSGSETLRSATAVADCLRRGLAAAGLPQDAVQLIPTKDRSAVGAMLAGAHGGIDVIVPRGGRSLVERVQSEARVPVFAHLEGLCHVFIHAAANLQMARDIVVNAKMRRTGICGAAETLLVDSACAATHLPVLAAALDDAGCELRGDARAQAIAPMAAATEEDFATEYLAPVISIAVVDGLEGALAHIARYSSHHTDAIVTEDASVAERFLAEVDSAIVMVNASTQFADGGEFGMGAEIGIATGRMHARGPVGVEQLTTFKYQVRGAGQTRP